LQILQQAYNKSSTDGKMSGAVSLVNGG